MPPKREPKKKLDLLTLVDHDEDRDVLHHVQNLSLQSAGKKWGAPVRASRPDHAPSGPAHSAPGRGSRPVPGLNYVGAGDQSAGGAAGSAPDAFSMLVSMFPGIAPDVVLLVLEEWGGDVDAAAAALLELDESAAPGRNRAAAPADPGPTHSDRAAQSDQASTATIPAAEDTDVCTWDDVPHDVKVTILGLLQNKELARVSAVSREFRQFVNSRRSKVPTLNVTPGLAVGSPDVLAAAIRAHQNLRALNLSKCGSALRTADDFEALFQAVAIGDATRAASCLPSESAVPARIESLDLRNCYALNDDDVAALCESVPTLRDLGLSGCEQLTDRALQTLSRYSRGGEASLGGRARGAEANLMGLNSLNVAGLLKITDEGIKALWDPHSYSLRSLASLDVSSTKIRGACLAALPPQAALRSLRAQRMLALKTINLRLGPSSVLEDLSLAFCAQLRRVELQCPTLTTCTLSDCRELKELDLRCPSLRNLIIANCCALVTVSAGGKDPLDEPSPAEVSPDQPVPSMAVWFGSLEDLNCFGARQLDGLQLEGFLSHALGLKRLNVTGCKALSALAVPSDFLESVEASGSSVRALRLRSTSLRTLKAVGAKQLTLIDSPTSVLTLLDVTNCDALASVQLKNMDRTPSSMTQGEAWRVVQAGAGRSQSQGLEIQMRGVGKEAEASLRRLGQQAAAKAG